MKKTSLLLSIKYLQINIKIAMCLFIDQSIEKCDTKQEVSFITIANGTRQWQRNFLDHSDKAQTVLEQKCIL